MLLIEDRASEDTACWKYSRLDPAPLASTWNDSAESEAKVHRIHAYPARFPSFLVHKALEHARERGVRVTRVADVFCGSGTVTCEAAALKLGSWGCDVNPVATLIARVKAAGLDPVAFRDRATRIVRRSETSPTLPPVSASAVARLERWYRPEQFEALARLRNAMLSEVGAGELDGEAFDCAFSAIVKGCSQWRSRSMKPANDPTRRPVPVAAAFQDQCRRMVDAFTGRAPTNGSASDIILGDVNAVNGPERRVDLIVTSPPYATSCEYADLHQLSALWLGYAEDHRDLQRGTIGTSRRRTDLTSAVRGLNTVGMQVVFSMFDRDRATAEALATYFLDMQRVARRCHEFLRPGGVSVFVIGNTRLAGVRIDSANHLVESLLEAGFADVRVLRRRPGKGMNTPHRSADGRLSSSRTELDVYAEEYVVTAQRP